MSKSQILITFALPQVSVGKPGYRQLGLAGGADPVASGQGNPEIPVGKSGEKKWARTDTNAKRFRATKSGGPDWNLVT